MNRNRARHLLFAIAYGAGPRHIYEILQGLMLWRDEHGTHIRTRSDIA